MINLFRGKSDRYFCSECSPELDENGLLPEEGAEAELVVRSIYAP